MRNDDMSVDTDKYKHKETSCNDDCNDDGSVIRKNNSKRQSGDKAGYNQEILKSQQKQNQQQQISQIGVSKQNDSASINASLKNNPNLLGRHSVANLASYPGDVPDDEERYISECVRLLDETLEHHKDDIPKSGNRLDDKMKTLQPQVTTPDESELNLSFCGCGFLGIYHVGVATAFLEYAPRLSAKKISGSSAGALVAVSHVCGNLQLAYAITDFLSVAIHARSKPLGPFHPSFDINALIRESLERGLPDDVHLKASGRLHVSLTRVRDGANVIISEFESKQDVIQVLLCSCFIPFWTGLVAPKFKGVSYIDGGFSNNLLTLNSNTITVSPFAGEADVCPQDDTFNLLQVSLSNTSFSLSPNNLYRLSHALLPSPPEVLSQLCEQGFADAIRFLQARNLISCTKCVEIRSSLLVTTNGEDLQEAFEAECRETTAEEVIQHTDVHTSTHNHGNLDHHHIILEQQEQKLIQISGRKRRDSVVSTSSHQFHQHQQTSGGAWFTQHELESERVEVSETTSTFLTTTSEHDCHECRLIRERAIQNSLPQQFAERVRIACDNVNTSLSNWIHSNRAFKYLSYLASPYYIPLDVTLALLYRCWRRLPFLRSELVDCLYNLGQFLIGILKRAGTGESTSATLLRSALSYTYEQDDKIGYEKGILRSVEGRDTVDSGKAAPAKPRSRSNAHEGAAGGAAGVSSSATRQSDEGVCGVCYADDKNYSVKITNNGLCVCKLSGKSRSPSTTHLHSLEDTFDSIADVTSKQEARIFAYYFRDSKNRLQVTEIFDHERASLHEHQLQ